MHAYNTTRQQPLMDNGKIANALLTRMKGLLGHPELLPGQGLIIDPCNSIHTFFMQYPIDVVFVAESGTVVGLAPERPPNRVGPVVLDARFVIELPPGTIDETGTQIGDEIVVGATHSTSEPQ